MTVRRRRLSGRGRPEVFGLATLDTVTCALGGAIALMILMAAVTPPSAPQIVPLRLLFQGGGGIGSPTDPEVIVDATEEPRIVVQQLAIVFIDFPEPYGDLSASVTGRCDIASPAAGFLRGQDVHPGDDLATSSQHALVIWTPPGGERCGRLVVEIEYADEHPRCDLLLISGPNYETRNDFGACPQRVELGTVDGNTFRIDRVNS
ncbi:MAG: hypothetical protein OXJ64_00265 [Boseongicola sp.]|nr:hypothetical protein [Boseongicola sp.]